MKYIDLVLCQHPNDNRNFLFVAPAWSRLQRGDNVMVDTRNGKCLAIVQDTALVEKDSDLYIFIVTASKATLPLKKVISKIEYHEFEYEEESDE